MVECIDVICRACAETNSVHVVHEISQTGLVDRICQIVIAAVAAIGTVVGLFRSRIDRKLNSPSLEVRFSEALPYYDIEEVSTENKKIQLKIGVENTGPFTAMGCSVKLLSVVLACNNQEIPLQATKLQKKLKRIDQTMDGCEIESGGRCLFEVGEISVDKDEKDVEGTSAVAGESKACIELHCSDGSIERLRPHQSQVNILIVLCAANFTPRKFVLHVEWKGQSVSDIGTVGAFSCSVAGSKKM